MQPLNRIFLEIGPITIYWYGILIGAGVLLGLWAAIRESTRQGLEKDIFVDLLIITLPISILTARAYFVIFQWDFYSQNLDKIVKVWNGGLAIHGGLIGAFLVGNFFAKKRGVSFWVLADIAAPSLLIGQAIGRWGNFMNQEAFGGVVSRGFLENLFLPDFIINQMYINGAYHHPTFLYESLWNLIGLGILLLFRRWNLRSGEIFLSYLIWYSSGRFFIEGSRTDSLMLTGSLKMAQALSLFIICISIIVFIYRRKKPVKN